MRALPINQLAKDILTAIQSASAAETTALEQEIDEHIYCLYLPTPRLRLAGGLTPEEIKMVEDGGKSLALL